MGCMYDLGVSGRLHWGFVYCTIHCIFNTCGLLSTLSLEDFLLPMSKILYPRRHSAEDRGRTQTGLKCVVTLSPLIPRTLVSQPHNVLTILYNGIISFLTKFLSQFFVRLCFSLDVSDSAEISLSKDSTQPRDHKVFGHFSISFLL